MPHNLDLIFTLTAALVAALALGLLTRRVGLSPIIGYMLAGIFLGRHALGYVANYDIASELAEIGVILLMFGVGLQFDLKELLAVRGAAIPGALVQIAISTMLGAVTAHGFGWDWGAGILFGLSISVASTVVLTRILSDNNALHTQTGHIAIGWLVVEDIFTVLVLVLVPAFAGQRGEGAKDPTGNGGRRARGLLHGLHHVESGSLPFSKTAAKFIGQNRVLRWLLEAAASLW